MADLVSAEDVQERWDGLDVARRRAVIDTLMTVVIHPAGRGTRYFNPNSVQLTPR